MRVRDPWVWHKMADDTTNRVTNMSLSWDSLVTEVRSRCSNDVDVDDLKKLMSMYISDSKDWNVYGNFDPHRYTRNLVDTGNEKYNLIVICWGEGQGSCIHSHAGSHCIMKVLSGTLKETQFHWPESEEDHCNMKVKESSFYHKDDVTYINDGIGLHRIENPSHTDTAISLHLYFPPIEICQTFDEQTSKSRQCKACFYSRYGQKC